MSLLSEVRRIYAREHSVFRSEMSPLRTAIARPGVSAPTVTPPRKATRRAAGLPLDDERAARRSG